MSITTDYSEIYDSVQESIRLGDLSKALELLNGVDETNADARFFILQSKIYHLQGRLEAAVLSAERGVEKYSDDMQLLQRKNEYQAHLNRLNKALLLIADGQHASDEINFAKSNTVTLIDSQCFEPAIVQLTKLSEARKAKTTNILWIGSLLKDVYFHSNASNYQNIFTDLLFEEMLFYYLKSCKLFEPEYKKIQEAKKALKTQA